MSENTLNERKTENLVRDMLRKRGYYDDSSIVIEEQKSDNPKIDKLLKSASKSGSGRGYPEFIISFKNEPRNLIVIECKASTKDHQSKDRKQYSRCAVDGVLLYANYLKDSFNVIAIAVSGETEREVKISHFLWLQEKHTYKDISDKTILDPESIFSIVEKQSKPLKEEELVKKAIEYNKNLHSYSTPEVERCTLISSILVALQDISFTNTFHNYTHDKDDEDYNPNIVLLDELLGACKRIFRKNKISDDKMEIILREYEKIKSNHTFRSKVITKNKKKEQNTILRDLIDDINTNIMPYINKNVYDVLGKFYTQFIRYAGSDSKTGLVLTPTHVADFFCDIAEIKDNDIVFDPCCGTGGFLVSSMKYMLEKSGNDLKRQKEIKSNQLIGIEKRADMFAHACSNMMMRGDGKSNIYFGDCFDEDLKEEIKKKKPTKALLNPPYDVGEAGQLEFIENSLECIEKSGICVAICQMSTVVSSKKDPIIVRGRLLEKHTLKAVFSMPNELFHPIGVVTCILVFEAHNPHPKNKETFFGYFKNDGFVKQKDKGRVDCDEKWSGIKKEWLSAYVNNKEIAGLSATRKIKAEDEWCAEAYMSTDYSDLTNDNFSNVIRDFVAFKILSKQSTSGKIGSKAINKSYSLGVEKWEYFNINNIFPTIEATKGGTTGELTQGDEIPYIAAKKNINGLDMMCAKKSNEQFISEGNCIVFIQLGAGSAGYTTYQEKDFIGMSGKTSCGYNDKLNKYNGLFLVAILDKERPKFSFGRSWTGHRLTSTKIKLPVNQKGEPDWKFMEEYIKSLPYSSNL